MGDARDRVRKHSKHARQLSLEIIGIDREKREKERAIERLEDDVKVLRSEQKATYKNLTQMVSERTRVGEKTLDAKFIAILKKYGIQIQAYHGGSLTGGHILSIYKNLEEIFDELKKECLNTLSTRRDEEGNLPIIEIPSDAEVEKVLEDHFDLLQIQDAVYSSLRIIAPTERELEEAKERIQIMKNLWTEMGFSITPKAHLVFTHAIKDMIDFGGLGDKIEDSLERTHQEQRRYDHVTMRMAGCAKKLRRQAGMRWRNGNPEVISWMKKVKDETSYPMTLKKTEKRDVVTLTLKRKAEREVKREDAIKKRK